MPLPSVTIKRSRSRGGRAGAFRWRGATERTMHAMGVEMVSELSGFSRQVHRVPEEHAIEVLAPDRADQALNEAMRDRRVRNRLDLLDPSISRTRRLACSYDHFNTSARWPTS